MKNAHAINLTLFITFLLCCLLVITTGTNEEIFTGINSAAAHISPFIWANLTFLGDTMAACSIMLLFIRKWPDLVWSGIAATIAATIIVNVLKSFLDFPRPAAVISPDQINLIGPLLLSHSFPSGHTVTIFTLAGILMFFFRSVYIRIAIFILALLIGISRIAVGAHWPADVLAGASLGVLCATAGVYLVSRLGWNRNRLKQLVTGALLIVSDLYLLLFYRSGYEKSIYLQYLLALSVLITGMREFYLLYKDRRPLSNQD